MNSVHSEDLGVTITGNIITRHNIPAEHLAILGAIYGQVSIQYTGGEKFDVSAPMTTVDHGTFAGLIHRLNTENKLSKKSTNGVDGNPDGTPPSGGTPGTPIIVKQEFIEAIAA